ncbi:Protein of unknown function [Gryllus bimaculatus]|nr:Protein of unknown function [Gryllus bimaculatus]
MWYASSWCYVLVLFVVVVIVERNSKAEFFPVEIVHYWTAILPQHAQNRQVNFICLNIVLLVNFTLEIVVKITAYLPSHKSLFYLWPYAISQIL